MYLKFEIRSFPDDDNNLDEYLKRALTVAVTAFWLEMESIEGLYGAKKQPSFGVDVLILGQDFALCAVPA